jgi:ATP-dependent metalloprotease
MGKADQSYDQLASALVQYETLNLDEVKQVLAGKKLQRLASLGDSLKGTKEATAGPDGPIVEGI